MPSIPIFKLRDQAVIIDADLARLYGVPTGRLNEQVKRNAERFPADFIFQLTREEWQRFQEQLATSSAAQIADERSQNPITSLRSQNAILKKGRGQHRKFLPFAFTEHGALMAANVLNSPEAVKMSVFIIRAFIKQREALTANATVFRRLAEIDKTLLLHDKALRDLYQKLLPLLAPPREPPRPPHRISQRRQALTMPAARL